MPLHRMSMTLAEFDEIPNKVVPRTLRLKDPTFETPPTLKWIFNGYCEKLIFKNESLMTFLEPLRGKADEPAYREGLSDGQRMLLALSALDGQISNGGITQFFWNCPDLVFEVSEALTILDEPEVTAAYLRAIDELVTKKIEWKKLKKQASKNDVRFWDSFQASYGLLNLDWFNEDYFKKCQTALIARLMDYVKSHKDEFIE